jgi:hypothetical protein
MVGNGAGNLAADRVKAEEHLVTATAMYRAMDMGFWLEKAEAELGSPLETHPEPGRAAPILNPKTV